MNHTYILGADIGGSHITAALINLQTASILPDTLCRLEVDSHGTREEILDTWQHTLQSAIGNHQLPKLRLGISMPGPFDYESGTCLIKNQDKYDALYNLNVKKLLANRFNISTGNIRLINDAGAFLKGEVFAGAAQGFKDVLGVTLGTGLGTSRYHQHLAEDANRWCAPFLDGIAEDYLSTRWFVKKYEELTGNKIKGVKALAQIGQHDSQVRKIFDEFGKNLSLFLAEFITQEKPEIVVLGGNIAQASNLFLSTTEKLLQKQNIHIPIRNAALGESAALIGAASCWYVVTPVALPN